MSFNRTTKRKIKTILFCCKSFLFDFFLITCHLGGDGTVLLPFPRRNRSEKKVPVGSRSITELSLSRRHFYVSLHYWSTQNFIIFITKNKSEGCKMMRMSCPSFSVNVFRLAVGGRVLKMDDLGAPVVTCARIEV